MKRAFIPFVLALAAIAGASLLWSAAHKDDALENTRPDDLRKNGAL